MSTPVSLIDYSSRFDRRKHWKKVLQRAGRSFQSAESNEIQDIAEHRAKLFGDSLFSDGQVISGCEPSIDRENSLFKLSAGTVYIDGDIHEVYNVDNPSGEISLPIALTGTVVIGLYLDAHVITELDDPSLYSQARGAADYGKPGAGRLTIEAKWITDAALDVKKAALETKQDNRTITPAELETLNSLKKFYPVYTVTDGALVILNNTAKTDDNDNLIQNIARYDRESHGNYVSEGLTVRAIEPETPGTQEFSIAAGHAHIDGYEVTLSHSKTLKVPESADILSADSEPHNFIAETGGSMRVNLNHSPVDTITRVNVTLQATETITHGSYTGCRDGLSHTSITRIVSVKQGGTTYEAGTDFILSADLLDWSPTGSEPSPSSQYEVTYQYRAFVEPINPDTTGFTIENGVAGTDILVSYTYRLPRKDLIVLGRDSTLSLVKGVAHRSSPVVPETPPNMLCLAIVTQTWNGLPQITNNAIQAVSMGELKAMQQGLNTLFDAVATLELKNDALATSPSSAYGIFVDPFIDNDMRDGGIEQDAVIVDEMLVLPVQSAEHQFNFESPQVLEYIERIVLEQAMRSGSMPINPYQAFAPMPIKMGIEPSVDHYVQNNTRYEDGGQVVLSTTRVWGYPYTRYQYSTVRTDSVAVTVSQVDKNLRVRDVRLQASGLGPNERYSVTFDGRTVISNAQADANGNVDRTFTIPSGLSAGTKLVELKGTASNGSATYTGSNTITNTVIRRTTYVNFTIIDPLAQTFTLDEARHITGVNLWFTKKGSAKVRVQIRETSLGYPTETVLAQGEIAANSIRLNNSTRINFDFPVFLNAGTMYAIVVLTDSPDHELAIGELSKFDQTTGKWITSQPYTIGTLLSSSNATAWTIHQNADLWFQIVAAEFTNPRRVIDLGTVDFSEVTDLYPVGEIETTDSGTDVTFVILDSNDSEIARVQAGQALALNERISGPYKVKAELVGNTKLSPVLYGGMQLLAGSLINSGTYVSRAFTCGSNKKVRITLETYTPGSSRVDVKVQTAENTFTTATEVSYENVGNGWRRVVYECPCSLEQTRLKITMTGTPSERPQCAKLRAVVNNAS